MNPVKAIRIAQGKTLIQLSQAGGGPHFTVIGRIENGMRAKPDQIEKIARGLDVRPEHLERAIRLAQVEG